MNTSLISCHLVIGEPRPGKITTKDSKAPFRARKEHEWVSTHCGHPFAGGGPGRSLEAAWDRRPQSRSRDARPGAEGPDVLGGTPGSVFVAFVRFFVPFVEAFDVHDQAEAHRL